jgi:ABC-type branched-subunit amino acid transport system ATPase component
MSADSPPMIEAIGVSKSFGGVRAVRNCSFSARAGAITGLIGPNGAGKSTLIAILSGALRPDSGSVRLGEHDVTRLSDWRRARAGLVRTFQVSRPLGRLTVVENMLVGSSEVGGETFSAALFKRRTWMRAQQSELERASGLLERFGLTRVAQDYAETLSGGQQRLLELARALMARPKVLLLDEPFAGVNPTLAHELADHIEGLKDSGLAIVLIEHDLALVGRLCNPVVVMSEGTVLAEGHMDDISANADVVTVYLGQAAAKGGDAEQGV